MRGRWIVISHTIGNRKREGRKRRKEEKRRGKKMDPNPWLRNITTSVFLGLGNCEP